MRKEILDKNIGKYIRKYIRKRYSKYNLRKYIEEKKWNYIKNIVKGNIRNKKNVKK